MYVQVSSNSYSILTPLDVINGYTNGIFPMGNNNGTVEWYYTEPRAIIPVDIDSMTFRIPRSLIQVLKKDIFEIRVDTNFVFVIQHCAHRMETWINKLIFDTYVELFKMGYAHSVESYIKGKIVGGLYGVALRGVFFGESMFHIENNASKVCLAKLLETLKLNGYMFLDIQMLSPVFLPLGAITITHKRYLNLLKQALTKNCYFKIKRIKQ
ncbi:MAG: leucyl/phenylalanyl-tRNA--protein transferase [Ignavibacteria bacterium]